MHEELSLMQKFADPELMHSMSMSEKMAGAAVTTLMGMGITFVVLLLLWGIVAGLTKIFQEKEKKPDVVIEPAAAVAIASAPLSDIAVAEQDDAELAAVIAAAISASTGRTQDSFVVKRINRASGFIPAWGKAGQRDIVDSRRM